MINCSANVSLSPLTERKFCKIAFNSFDIEYDKVQNFLKELDISFAYEYETKTDEGNSLIITSLKNYYYYSRPSLVNRNLPRVELILSNIFFDKTKLCYEDIISMLNNNYGLLLMYSRSSSENFSKIARMLCKVNVKDIKICQ